MKQTVIKYQKLLDEKIKIVGFDNISSPKNIEKTLGEVVGEAYRSTFPNYGKIDSEAFYVNISPDKEAVVIEVGQVVTKDSFQQLISTMKTAGKRLVELQENLNDTIHEVRI